VCLFVIFSLAFLFHRLSSPFPVRLPFFFGTAGVPMPFRDPNAPFLPNLKTPSPRVPLFSLTHEEGIAEGGSEGPLPVSVHTFCTFSFSRLARCFAYLPVCSRPARQARLIRACAHHRCRRVASRETAPSSAATIGKVQKVRTDNGPDNGPLFRSPA